MQRVRVIVRHDPSNPTDDLRWAARLRRDLWAHLPVEVNPGSPRHGTHRDADRNAYFEFATDRLPEVQRVVREFGQADRTTVEVVQEGDGTECVNCGNITPQNVAVCPTCQFRDIAPCPYCNSDVARLAYVSVFGEVFRCPTCDHRVRFRFNDPMFAASGRYNQPLVCVDPDEVPGEHDL